MGALLAVGNAVERIERAANGWRVVANGTTHEGQIAIEADDVIAATAWTPLLDLPSLGSATVRHGAPPPPRPPPGERHRPGSTSAGNATQAAAGLRKHGVASALPAQSAAFATTPGSSPERIAEVHFGRQRPRAPVAPDDVAPLLAGAAARSPELWSQKSYLARVVTLGGKEGPVDEGIRPLAAFLDEDGPTALAVAVEMNGEGGDLPRALHQAGELDSRGHVPASPAPRVRRAGLHEAHPLSGAARARMTEVATRLVVWGALLALPLVGLVVLPGRTAARRHLGEPPRALLARPRRRRDQRRFSRTRPERPRGGAATPGYSSSRWLSS